MLRPMITLTLAFLLSACLTFDPSVVPAVPATVQELQDNSVRVAPLMVICRTNDQRRQVLLELTAAQIRSANTTFRNGSMPSGCAPARPPEGTFIEISPAQFDRSGQPVWFVDMYYPSNPHRPWLYVVADQRILFGSNFERRGRLF